MIFPRRKCGTDWHPGKTLQASIPNITRQYLEHDVFPRSCLLTCFSLHHPPGCIDGLLLFIAGFWNEGMDTVSGVVTPQCRLEFLVNNPELAGLLRSLEEVMIDIQGFVPFNIL